MSKLYLEGNLIENSDYVNNTEIKTGETYNGHPVYCDLRYLTGVNFQTGTHTYELFRIPNIGYNVRIRAILGGGIVLPAVEPYTIHCYVYMNVVTVDGITYGVYYLKENNTGSSDESTSLQVYAYHTKITD